MTRLNQFLKIQPGEGVAVGLLLGLMLATSAGGSIGGSGIDALFISRFGVDFLPQMYMALGPIMFVVSIMITALLSRIPRKVLYTLLPLALGGILAAERAVVALDLNWFYPVLWLGMNVLGMLQGLLTWGLAGMVMTTRQAKRLFPLIAAGNILGAVVGGLSTSILVEFLGSANLLLVWAGALALAFVLARILMARTPAAPPVRSRKKQPPIWKELQKGYQTVFRSPLMRWVAAMALLFSLLFFSLAFPFSKAAAAQFPDEDALAGFFGVFTGITTGVAFLVSIFVANRLFSRFGIMTMILILPVIYLLGFGSLTFVASFPILVGFKFIQTLWMFGVAGTAWQAAYNVIPSDRRDQVRAFIDGVPNQAGTFAAGLILLVGEQTLEPRHLYLIGLGFAVLTVVSAWRARRAYSGALVDALREGQPEVFYMEDEPFGGFQQDADAVNVAIESIFDLDPVKRRVAAEVLGQLAVPRATNALVVSLKDEDGQVRAAAIRGLAAANATPALLEIAACLHDDEAEVRYQAIESLRRLSPYRSGLVAQIRPLLGDDDPAIRARVAVAMLQEDEVKAARDMLDDLIHSDDADARHTTVEALSTWETRDAFDLVVGLIGDPAALVRRAIPDALTAIDEERALDPLLQLLADEDRLVRERTAIALAGIGPTATERVIAALDDPAREHGALHALRSLPIFGQRDRIRAYGQGQIGQAEQYHDLATRIGPAGAGGPRALLVDSLHNKARYHALNALHSVGLLTDPATVSLAIESLNSRNPADRANALETLDSLGQSDLIQPLLPLWESAPDEEGEIDIGALETVLSDTDPWLRACAVLLATSLGEKRLEATISRLAESDPDDLVRDTAATGAHGDKTMETLVTLSMMDRIIFLRRVPLFADLPPADLKHVASIAAEQRFSDGEVIAEQGDPGDEMYIIVHGAVRVVSEAGDKPVELAVRQSGEYVGEMAIINHKPRMASLVASGELRTLTIGQKQFEGILRERPDTSLAVIRVLSERLEEK